MRLRTRLRFRYLRSVSDKVRREIRERAQSLTQRWIESVRRAGGFATSEVQVSETETPLHRWETVYRRLAERLATADTPDGALRSIVDAWFYTLEEDVLASGKVDPSDAQGLLAATDALVEQRLSVISRTAPAFSAVLRAFRRALVADDTALAEIAWLDNRTRPPR